MNRVDDDGDDGDVDGHGDDDAHMAKQKHPRTPVFKYN